MSGVNQRDAKVGRALAAYAIGQFKAELMVLADLKEALMNEAGRNNSK
ncbi:MAG: hypothetical protein AAGD92_10540 [Pseudomonadota bacterium]